MLSGIRTLILGALTFALCGMAAGQQASKEVSLQISEQAGKYVLTVPVSRLVMTIPKGSLTRRHNSSGGAADSPRYFLFEDEAHHLIVSGWFESDNQFSGINQFWSDEMAAWKKNNLPDARDVSFENFGSWQTIQYDIAAPAASTERAIGNSHIRAHWVQDGTWIDVHLSLTSNDSQAERRDRLRDALKAIQVSEKKP